MEEIKQLLLKSIFGPPHEMDWRLMFEMTLTANNIPEKDQPNDEALAEMLTQLVQCGLVTLVIKNGVLIPASLRAQQ